MTNIEQLSASLSTADQFRCKIVRLGTAEEEARLIAALKWLLENAQERDGVEAA
jgi:hypothetical protein